MRQRELLVATTSDLGAARSLAETLARGVVEPERVGDVVLAASELVTNALEHGSGPARLEVAVGEDALRVRVESASDGEVTIPDAAPPTAVRGRGLLIVTAVADAVDVDTSDEGVVVSCSFRRAPSVTDGG